ncbi:polysaccharide pyruvyl transferase family protein [Micromonospora sp. CPCC 205561]|uniref:polysaccharide pyruvyl transferase family protein n=1 Tax=Micromonospora sp. CPCC 205561 TaxID=3122407 RepID=UPI002FF1C950
MRVAVVTLHTPLNFGSALQAYALCRVLQDLGHDVELVDYHRPTHSGWQMAKRRLADHSGSSITRAWHLVDRSIEAMIAGRRFRAFLQATTPLSRRRYRSVHELTAKPPLADVYLTGSDQVWNSVYNEGVEHAFYLAFAPPSARRVSYAASFGLDELPSDEHEATCALLKRYDAVAVREQAGLRILRKLGLGGTRVLDPTLLLSQEQWTTVASSHTATDDYVLVYSVEQDRMTAAADIARTVADARNAPVYQVTFGGYRRHIVGVDRTFHFTSPAEFLALFANAGFVVTSSFHGTAFSLIFSKQFYSIAPPQYGGRTGDLLSIVGLAPRLVTPDTVVDPAAPAIKYDRVHSLLDQERARSRNYLTTVLSR